MYTNAIFTGREIMVNARLMLILSLLYMPLFADQYREEKDDVSQESFRKCKVKRDEYLKRRLREVLGVNVDLDDARKQFGFPIAAIAIMNQVRACAANSSWWSVDDRGIKDAIEKEITNYVLNVGSSAYPTTEIHESDVMAHVEAMTREKMKHRPDIRANSSVVSERVKNKVKTGYVTSRFTSDGQNRLYNLSSLYQVIHQEIINEKSNQEKMNSYEYGYQQKLELLGSQGDIRRLGAQDIATSQLEQFVKDEVHRLGGKPRDVQRIMDYINRNQEVYLQSYYVYTYQDKVEGCYDKNTIKSVVKDNL